MFLALHPVSGDVFFSCDTWIGVIRASTGSAEFVTGDLVNRGHVQGTGGSVRFDGITGLVLDRRDNRLFMAERGNHGVRDVMLSDAVLSVNQTAGASSSGTPGYMDAAAELARFDEPMGMAWDSFFRRLYIADRRNHAIRVVDMTGLPIAGYAAVGPLGVWTLVGGPLRQGFFNGHVKSANISSPLSVMLDPMGRVYFAELGSTLLRQVSNDQVTPVVGTGMSGSLNVPFNSLSGLCAEPSGRHLFAVDSNDGQLFSFQAQDWCSFFSMTCTVDQVCVPYYFGSSCIDDPRLLVPSESFSFLDPLVLTAAIVGAALLIGVCRFRAVFARRLGKGKSTATDEVAETEAVTKEKLTKEKPKRRVMPWVVMLLAILDVSSDISFILFVKQLEDFDDFRLPYYLSISFVGFPMVANFVALIVCLTKAIASDAAFASWLENNMCGTSLFLVLGAINVVALELMSTRLCSIGNLSAPRFAPNLTYRIEYLGLITYLCEDVPQLLIQIYVAVELGTLETAQAFSFLFTGLNVTVGITKRGLRFLFNRYAIKDVDDVPLTAVTGASVSDVAVKTAETEPVKPGDVETASDPVEISDPAQGDDTA